MSTDHDGVTELALQLLVLNRRELHRIGLSPVEVIQKARGVCGCAAFTALDVYMNRIQGQPDPAPTAWPFMDPPQFAEDVVSVLVSALGFLICELEGNLIARGKTMPLSPQELENIERNRMRERGHG